MQGTSRTDEKTSSDSTANCDHLHVASMKVVLEFVRISNDNLFIGGTVWTLALVLKGGRLAGLWVLLRVTYPTMGIGRYLLHVGGTLTR